MLERTGPIFFYQKEFKVLQQNFFNINSHVVPNYEFTSTVSSYQLVVYNCIGWHFSNFFHLKISSTSVGLFNFFRMCKLSTSCFCYVKENNVNQSTNIGKKEVDVGSGVWLRFGKPSYPRTIFFPILFWVCFIV